MGAVKRVKKLLGQIEKRASDRARGEKEKGSGRPSRGSGPPSVQQVNAVLARDREEVLVKASGRAMQQALKVGEWFRDREKDVICGVDVRHGNVTVVDDIVEVPVESDSDDVEAGAEDNGDHGNNAEGEESEVLDPGETTLELMGDATVTTIVDDRPDTDHGNDNGDDKDPQNEPQQQDSHLLVKNKRKRKRRKRPEYDPDDVPEARMRWIKTVEVAIWLEA